jgi:hypothetical protein
VFQFHGQPSVSEVSNFLVLVCSLSSHRHSYIDFIFSRTRCSCATWASARVGHHCGDIELPGYLTNAAVQVPLVLDLLIDHDRFGSSSNPNLDGKLHWPNDMDKSLNETVVTRSENIGLTIIITHLTLSLLCRLLPVRLGDSIVNLSEFYSYRFIGKLTALGRYFTMRMPKGVNWSQLLLM